jgi:hypothetical protein
MPRVLISAAIAVKVHDTFEKLDSDLLLALPGHASGPEIIMRFCTKRTLLYTFIGRPRDTISKCRVLLRE